jgi:hypothetical protein
MRLQLTALAAAALACVGVPTAQAKGPVVLSQVVWDKTPSREDVAEAFAAASARAGDKVALVCRINFEGRLGGCDVEADAQSADNVARTARRLARQFRVDLDALGPLELSALRVRLVIQAPDPTGPDAITSPEWIRSLSADEIQEVFPPKAADAGLKTGRAVLDCVADAHGMMTACQVSSEDPAGMDFGPAAVRVASAMGVNPWTEDGEPAEGAHVKFAVRLNRQEPAAPAS